MTAAAPPSAETRVTAHRVDLRDDRHVQPRVRLHGRDGGPQTCSATAHHHHIVAWHVRLRPAYSACSAESSLTSTRPSCRTVLVRQLPSWNTWEIIRQPQA